MPLSKYFRGRGEQVMSSMEKTYGTEKAKRVFYATANKQKDALDSVVKTAKRRHKAKKAIK